MGPNVASVVRTRVCMSGSSETSHARPSPPKLSPKAFAASTSRSATVTRVPSAAKRDAIAAPMPLAPPVTMTVLSFRYMGSSHQCLPKWQLSAAACRAPVQTSSIFSGLLRLPPSHLARTWPVRPSARTSS